jgi:hypothetical protein
MQSRRILLIVFFVSMFSLAYAQAPLFTSNQNQYFLHGMAWAGKGSLNTDWLANTREPTPLFSILVYLTFRLTTWNGIFYIYYVVLMGIYLYSLLGILDHVFNLASSRPRFWLVIASIVAFHSVALRYALTHWIGANWAFLLDGGLAGQRLLGTVFQPSSFGVFLLLSLCLFLRGRRVWAVVCAVLAATVHPTYLLTAGGLITGYLLVSVWLEYRWKQAVVLACLALATVAPVLIYVYINFGQEMQTPTGQINAEAQRILVEFRIPHHARLATWFDLTSVIKLGLIGAALFVVRKQRPLCIVLGVVFALATLLTCVQLLTHSETLALLFPWRSSALLMPLATTLVVGALAKHLPDAWLDRQRWLQPLCLGVILVLMLAGGVYMANDFRQKNAIPERAMLDWVASSSTDLDVYLIPVKLENFRLETLRPVYIDYMAIPYATQDVITWYHRVLATGRFYTDLQCDKVVDFVFDGQITHIVSGSDQPLNCPHLVPIYEDGDYLVYRVDFKSDE